MEIKDKTGCAGGPGEAWPTLQQRLVNLQGLTKAVASGYLGILELLGDLLPGSPTPLFGARAESPWGTPPPPPPPPQSGQGRIPRRPSLESVNFQKWVLSGTGV